MTCSCAVQLNSRQCQVVYETGETEELQVDELIREGIMSLGWVPMPGGGTRPESAGQLSVAGKTLRNQPWKLLPVMKSLAYAAQDKPEIRAG